MARLPQVSGRQLARLLESLGYERVRQRGSHARFELATEHGTHGVTVPMHEAIAKGTLGDILRQVANWTGVSRDELAARL